MAIDDRHVAREADFRTPIRRAESMMAKKAKITSAQVRAARALLNLSARRLSERSGVSQSTIHRAETAEGAPNIHQASLTAIKTALEAFGVEFLDDTGVQLRSRQTRIDAVK
jgi:transcriptional regulator with XRE-family HTH domain